MAVLVVGSRELSTLTVLLIVLIVADGCGSACREASDGVCVGEWCVGNVKRAPGDDPDGNQIVEG